MFEKTNQSTNHPNMNNYNKKKNPKAQTPNNNINVICLVIARRQPWVEATLNLGKATEYMKREMGKVKEEEVKTKDLTGDSRPCLCCSSF